MGEPSTCFVNKPTCDAKSDKNPLKVINSDENPFKPMNKLSRSPPPVNPVSRGRPTNKDNVSRRARSISNNRDSSSSSSSAFRIPRTNSLSQKMDCTPHRSDSNTKKRKMEDSAKEVDEPKSPTKPATPVSNKNKNTKICAACSKTFLKDDSSIECECCELWYHAGCQSLTEEAITAFKFPGEQATLKSLI